MTKIFFLFFSFLAFQVFALDFSQFLKESQAGDFVVIAQGKNYTLMHVYDRLENEVTFEEITAPCSFFSVPVISWRAWVRDRAPGHTAWVLYKVDLKTGKISSFYSLDKQCFLQIQEAENILSTLMKLPLYPLSEKERKKVGPPPDTGTPDRRSFWQPKLIVEGKLLPQAKFHAFRTRWPEDTSELSGKPIDLYFPDPDPRYPSYFPYWIQVYGIVGKASLRVVDSGSAFVSPAPPIPTTH